MVPNSLMESDLWRIYSAKYVFSVGDSDANGRGTLNADSKNL